MSSNTILPAVTPVDPSKVTIACEICGTAITVGDSFSFVITFATTGPVDSASGLRLNPFQCGVYQHFACSADHAAIAAKACIDEHLVPAHGDAMAQLRQTAAIGELAP